MSQASRYFFGGLLLMALQTAFVVLFGVPQRMGHPSPAFFGLMLLAVGLVVTGIALWWIEPQSVSDAPSAAIAVDKPQATAFGRKAPGSVRCVATTTPKEIPAFDESPDQRQFLIFKTLRIASVLEALADGHDFRDAGAPLVKEYYLDRTSSSPAPVEVARLHAHAEARRIALEADPHFRAAIGRLAKAGVTYAFGKQGDACGEFATLRLTAKADCLPLLEAMAADDAGIVDPADRAAAAERFHIYLLRNRDRNWRKNRDIHPDVGGSPYSDPAFWPKKT